MDFNPFCEFLCFRVRCLWSYCDRKPDDNIPNIFDRFRRPNFDEAKILKIQISFWDRISAIKCRVLAELSFLHVSYIVQDVRMADIRLASLVYLRCLRWHVLRAYCTFASKQAVSITLFGPRPNKNVTYFDQKPKSYSYQHKNLKHCFLKFQILRESVFVP